MSMQESKPRTPPRGGRPTRLLNSIGPAIVIAAVVLGPGSILTSSKIGAQLGYSAVWALVLACLLMIAMVSLATRIGVSFNQTPCGEIAARIGRPAAALVGMVMFLIIATFQSSNNIAIAASLEAFGIESGKSIEILVIAATNVLVIAFLYASRNTYRIIESAMKVLVLMMVVAFMLNCVAAKPDVSQIAAGLIPSHPGKEHWLLLVALMGTTFSVAAAFYQAYLVREKSWTEADRRAGVVDSFVGIATLGGISLVIMLTSAAVFFGAEPPVKLDSAADVAVQLNPFFGSWAQYIFGIGIFAGAISSFLVNALIGGHILADGLGLGAKIESAWTRHLTTAALLVGMLVAILSVSTGMSRVTLIVFAQALTVVGFPVLAIAMIYLGIIKRRENPSAMPRWVLISAVAGLFVIGLMIFRTVNSIITTLSPTS